MRNPWLAALLMLGACATPHPGSFKNAQADPWEKTNRKIYAFNKGADKYALKPIAQTYRAVVISPMRRGISNAFHNLREPLSLVNALLQGKVSTAFTIGKRFTINSVLGVGGLADHATDMGLPEQVEDFGQTFAYWGIDSGPYLMLPIFGPRTSIDSIGLAADFFLDPADYARGAVLSTSLIGKAGFYGSRAVVSRASLLEVGADGLLTESLDEYATVRAAFLQQREAEVWDGAPPEDDEFVDAPLAPGAQPVAPAEPTPKP